MYNNYEPEQNTSEFYHEDSAASQSQAYTANQQTPTSKPPKKHKKATWSTGRIIALALCCSLLGGAMGFGGAVLGNQLNRTPATTQQSASSAASTVLEGQRESATLQTAKVDTSKQMTASEVYAANVNSTVGITTSITTNYWGYQTTSAASGSGFILTSDGYILTNYHVVEGSNAIKVTTYSGDSYDASLIGYDENNDIAVLKVDASGLTPVVLGDSDNLNVGDNVLAIGNPLGELTFSLTQGVVSALNREITMSTGVSMDLIQTDCAINSGNSGGALFNLYGEVIGITNAKYSSNSSSQASIDNIGFAIPINHVKSIVEGIIENGYFAKPYLGITVTTVSEESQSYGLPQGAAVKSVTDGSPAQQAGLQENDIITAVNDTQVDSSTTLIKLVSSSTPGDTLTLQIYRQGQTQTLTVTVGEQIQTSDDTSSQDASQPQQEQQQGGSFPFGFGFGN